MSSSLPVFADVLLPLALEATYTYKVPATLIGQAAIGKRVEVQFGNRKRYAGLIIRLTNEEPVYRTKEIISIIDLEPIVEHWQIQFWNWIAAYYCCTAGEVMKAALPGGLLISSDTMVSMMPVDEEQILQLDSPLYEIMRIIQEKKLMTLLELEEAANLRSIYPHIVTLYKLGMILVVEELAEKYTPKQIKLIRLSDQYEDEERIHDLLDRLSKHDKQLRLVLAYISLSGSTNVPVEPKNLLAKSESSSAVLKTLIRKGIFEEITREVNRMDRYKSSVQIPTEELSNEQQKALQAILGEWDTKDVVLLHGITGSGKTIIYKELIKEIISTGGQVLYLVPEIGLSVQILNRLKEQFGQSITISHSRLTQQERVDLWKQVSDNIGLVAGVRSSIFLPFKKLRLVIVDEEHDISYKQQEPNPRYHARDAAIYLAKMLGAKVLLGSATPSVETYFQAEEGKFGKVILSERYLQVALPEIILIDKRKDKAAEGSIYSHSLIEEIRKTLQANKQVIIFKNRRGYAPVLKCGVCQWVAECPNCDITLTYHKLKNKLNCHVCGVTRPLIEICPACGSPRLSLEGYGTEKIEDELSIIFPGATIQRMDLDTTRGKHNLEKIIYNFENRKVDILVGTQMVTKGLDFDHVGLVGVIYADQALYYPDFRAAERTFQTLIQVGGRSGRKNERGKVMIQTYQPEHPVFRDVVHHDYESFYRREIKEREMFRYPPFFRQISITVKHKMADISREAAEMMAAELRAIFKQRIMGPAVPAVRRIRNQYIQVIYIRMERDAKLMKQVKDAIRSFHAGIIKKKAFSTVRISIDVDPYH